jgi:hypothetical protein
LPDAILRFYIDSQWNVSDFSEFFEEVQFLYEIAHFGTLRIDGQTSIPFLPLRRHRYQTLSWDDILDYDSNLGKPVEEDLIARLEARRFVRYFQPFPQLSVRAISYASPGFTDLVGAGKVLEQIRLFATDIMDRWIHKEDRRLDREAKAQEVFHRKIENCERLLALHDKGGMDGVATRTLIRELLKADLLIEGKMIEGKIGKVEILHDVEDSLQT